MHGSAQSYSVDWFKIAGGGGTGSNGQNAVSGTIGQQDAGAMAGGNFALTGGFWAISAVQTPGAPRLTIQVVNPTTAKVSWPSPSTGFLLQENLNIGTTNWSDFGGTTNDDGTNKSVTITPLTGNLFFRLKE